jgi:hypothetical protein
MNVNNCNNRDNRNNQVPMDLEKEPLLPPPEDDPEDRNMFCLSLLLST